jgi:hypothetical protein
VNRLSGEKCGNLDVSQPYGPSRPVTGIAFIYLYKKELPEQRKESIILPVYNNGDKN